MSQATLTANPSVSNKRRLELKAKLLWTGFILIFFVLQAILWTVAITAVANDPSHAVAASYQKNTMDWTQQQVLLAESAKLGWQVEIEMIDNGALAGKQTIRLTVLDRASQPVKNAQVKLSAFHMARAGQPQSVAMDATAPGVFVGLVRVSHSGRWKFEGSISRGGQTYKIDKLQHLTTSIKYTHPGKSGQR